MGRTQLSFAPRRSAELWACQPPISGWLCDAVVTNSCTLPPRQRADPVERAAVAGERSPVKARLAAIVANSSRCARPSHTARIEPPPPGTEAGLRWTWYPPLDLHGTPNVGQVICSCPQPPTVLCTMQESSRCSAICIPRIFAISFRFLQTSKSAETLSPCELQNNAQNSRVFRR